MEWNKIKTVTEQLQQLTSLRIVSCQNDTIYNCHLSNSMQQLENSFPIGSFLLPLSTVQWNWLNRSSIINAHEYMSEQNETMND